MHQRKARISGRTDLAQALSLVDELVAAVVARAGEALAVLVGHAGAHRLHHLRPAASHRVLRFYFQHNQPYNLEFHIISTVINAQSRSMLQAHKRETQLLWRAAQNIAIL